MMLGLNLLKELQLSVAKAKRPCCGFFLHGGVKAVAIADVGLELTMIIVLLVGIIDIQSHWNEEIDGSPHKHFARPFFWAYYFLYQVASIGMSIFLFKSANERNRRNLKFYLLVSIMLYIPWVGFCIVHLFWLGGRHPMVATTFAGVSAFKLYSFWVIYSFINEISYYGGFNAALKELTDAQIEEFENGRITEAHFDNYFSSDFQKRPYKRDFEISIERLELDEKTPLGSGTFGIVFKGNLHNKVVPTSTKAFVGGKIVAVKTAHPQHFNALLSELKILSYIGNHENIVNLIGACTSQIRKRDLNVDIKFAGKVFVIVEFCLFGNMMNYLRANRGLFTNLILKGEILANLANSNPYFTKIHGVPCTLDLIKWSMQTARGMEYISSKKVIHGDLAARNVLLTEDKNVKISDFGLSRQLYRSTTYIKHTEEPLPWRWMSVESLSDLKFSSSSDIWSYGVTLYEYYTLGALPFPDYSYSSDFLKQLKNGLRPEQPQYSNPEIYDMMKKCWELEPKCRPTFSELGMFFEKLLEKNVHVPNDEGIESGTFVSENELEFCTKYTKVITNNSSN